MGKRIVRTNWPGPVSDDEAARRAGGRRRYNAQRQAAVAERQKKLLEMIKAVPLQKVYNSEWREQTAEALGITRKTLLRDFNALPIQLYLSLKQNELLDWFEAHSRRRGNPLF